MSLISAGSVWGFFLGADDSTTGSRFSSWSSVPIMPTMSPGNTRASVGYGYECGSALYAYDVDSVFVSQVGVHKPFAHEGAVGSDGHICLMQVVDHGVFLAAAAQFAFVEVVEKFTLCGSCSAPSLREK